MDYSPHFPLSILPAQNRIFARQASSVAPRTPPSPSMCNCVCVCVCVCCVYVCVCASVCVHVCVCVPTSSTTTSPTEPILCSSIKEFTRPLACGERVTPRLSFLHFPVSVQWLHLLNGGNVDDLLLPPLPWGDLALACSIFLHCKPQY